MKKEIRTDILALKMAKVLDQTMEPNSIDSIDIWSKFRHWSSKVSKLQVDFQHFFANHRSYFSSIFLHIA